MDYNNNYSNDYQNDAYYQDNSYNQIQTTDYQYSDNNYSQMPITPMENEDAKKAKTLGIVGLCLGGASLLFGIFSCCVSGIAIISFPLAIAGLIVSIMSMKKFKEANAGNENIGEEYVNGVPINANKQDKNILAILGIVFSAVGIALSIAAFIFIIVTVIFAVGTSSSSLSSYSSYLH